MRSGYSTTIPRRKKYYAKPGQSLPSTSTSTLRLNIHGLKIMLCIWWDQKGLVYYELLKPGDSITGDRYRLQLIRLSRALKNGRNTSKDMIKLFFFMTTLGLMLLKVIKKYLETLKWDVLPYTPYSQDIAPSDYWLFRRMQHVTGSLLSQKLKIGSKIGSPPRQVIFSRWNSKIA